MKPSSAAGNARLASPVPSSPQHAGADFVIPSLDGLRAISVLIVAVAHAGAGDMVPGGLGVTIFFFLSGYLITTLLLSEHERNGAISITNFYIRRMFRLLPPLLVTLAVAYALAFGGFLGGGISLGGFLSQLFYFANYYSIYFDTGSSIPSGTGILWSLAVEEHFYIVYPGLFALLLASRLETRRMAIVFAGMCVAVLAWRYHLVGMPGFMPERTYYASDTRIDSILFGCILAVAFNPVRWQAGARGLPSEVPPMRFVDWALLAAAVLVVLATVVIRNPIFRETLRYTLQGLALMPIFYLSIRHAHRMPFALLNLPLIARIGVYSYAIYLIHQVVIRAIELNFPALGARKPVLLFATLAISIAFAAAIDRYVDPYFRSLRRRFHQAPQRHSAPSTA